MPSTLFHGLSQSGRPLSARVPLPKMERFFALHTHTSLMGHSGQKAGQKHSSHLQSQLQTKGPEAALSRSPRHDTASTDYAHKDVVGVAVTVAKQNKKQSTHERKKNRCDPAGHAAAHLPLFVRKPVSKFTEVSSRPNKTKKNPKKMPRFRLTLSFSLRTPETDHHTLACLFRVTASISPFEQFQHGLVQHGHRPLGQPG